MGIRSWHTPASPLPVGAHHHHRAPLAACVGMPLALPLWKVGGVSQWEPPLPPSVTLHERAGSVCRRPVPSGSNAPCLSSPPLSVPLPPDIRLRVRAEFCQHEPVLQQNVLSNKPHRLERQFDVFGQSNTILKSRDLGSIICDIKFSELSYLDAFWSDYMNGSLLEALKGVFLTESLKDAVGQEAIRLLVNVDEDDYEEGRRLLLESLGPQ
uniref:TRADD-like N-terminal domain-containing protein n=1 Tax=Chelydra serpentina TaxID=8475 RepID=A0A8C3SID2_CHESE